MLKNAGWRQLLLIAFAVSVCVYAITVLIYVSSSPDLGFRCAFSNEVKVASFARDEPKKPHVGDSIIQVGDLHLEPTSDPQWAQVKIFRELDARNRPLDKQRAKFEVVEAAGNRLLMTRGNETALAEAILKEHPDGQKEVLVRYQRNTKPDVSWCRLQRARLTELGPSILWFLLKLGLFAVGAIVYWKRPNDRSAAQFFLLCIVTLGAFMGGYHWARIAYQPALLLPFMVCAVLLPPVSLHFYLVFPRAKHLFDRFPRRMLTAIYGVPVVFLVALAGTYLQLRSARDTNSASQHAWEQFFRGELSLYIILAACQYVFCVAALLHSFRTAGNLTERNQVKWICGGAVVALGFILYTLYLVIWAPDDFGAGAGTWPMFAASVCFTFAFAISITRYRLMQLDQIVTSGMVYFFISFLAGMVYYAVVFIGMLVSLVKEPSLTQAVTVSATALLLLLGLDLVRGRVRKVLDRRFDRQKNQLDHTLQRMRAAIEQLVDPPTLANRALSCSAELLNVQRGAVYLREGEPPIYRLAGSLESGPPPLAELTAGCPLVEVLETHKNLTVWSGPITDPAQRQLKFLGGEIAHALAHDGRVLAFMILGPRAVGHYGRDELSLLAAFTQITALALEGAQGHRTIEALNVELQTKVEKISEQQRRIVTLQAQLRSAMSSSRWSSIAGENGATTADESGDRATTEDSQPSAKEENATLASTGIIGGSPVMLRLLDMVHKAAASPSAVLIRGESGTGKELLARALHENSPRAAKPYVKVHCAALSPTLLESELFGHVKGAFTGAHRDKVGRFEMADGGTIFLDEIGDISLEVQTKLLRVLQEKTFERVGSSDPVVVDVRVIAATHQDLEDLIRKERFRKDLYFRLKVIPITAPPLRERVEDIPELALHFVRMFGERSGRAIEQIDDDAMARLKAYSWPGNVRELENVMERAVVIAEGDVITVDELPPELLDFEPEQNGEHEPLESARPTITGLRAERARHERECLVRALAAAGGNKAEAARALRLARSTLVSRLKKHGLS